MQTIYTAIRSSINNDSGRDGRWIGCWASRRYPWVSSSSRVDGERMTVLRMPGYGAEYALGRAGTSYTSPWRAVADGAFTLQSILGRGGQPILGRGGTGKPPGHCDPTCLCVTPEGCPCCVQLPPLGLMARVAR